MRFTVAWAEIVKQNDILKWALGVLGVSFLALSFLVVKFAFKPPILIERACATSVIKPADKKRTQAETMAFLGEALRQRFDSDRSVSADYIDSKEIEFKRQEQKVLKEKNLFQKLFIHEHKGMIEGAATLDAVRLLFSEGGVLPIKFPLKVTLTSIDRSLSNPYGLKLVRTQTAESKDSSEE